MLFKALFIAHAPDADPEKHRCLLETSLYKLFVVVVRDQAQAIEVARKMMEEEGIHSILLCPGFTHGDVAQIQAVVGDRVAIGVARTDGPGSKVVQKVMAEVGWFRP